MLNSCANVRHWQPARARTRSHQLLADFRLRASNLCQ